MLFQTFLLRSTNEEVYQNVDALLYNESMQWKAIIYISKEDKNTVKYDETRTTSPGTIFQVIWSKR